MKRPVVRSNVGVVERHLSTSSFLYFDQWQWANVIRPKSYFDF